MSAAETPSAGHETAPNRGWLPVAVPAAGTDVPEGHAVGQEADLGSFAMARPARQPSAATQASAVSSARLVLRRR